MKLLVGTLLFELGQLTLHSDHVFAVGSQEVLLVLLEHQVHPVVQLHDLLVDGLRQVRDLDLLLVVDEAGQPAVEVVEKGVDYLPGALVVHGLQGKFQGL